MIPYFVLVLFPLLLKCIGKQYCVKMNNKIILHTHAVIIDAFMLIFLLLLAFRGLQCGLDTHQYLRLFTQYSSDSFSEIISNYGHEFGFKLLNKSIGLFTTSFQLYLSVTAAICVFPLWYFYGRESENHLLTIALFLAVSPFMMYFSGIRQSIAMSLGIPAWYAIKNKKNWLFLCYVFLAIQFHTSAFMLILLHPLYYARITVKWLWFVVPCIVVVYIFRNTIFSFLFTYLWKDYNITEGTGATTILILLILFGIYSFVIPDEPSLDQDTVAMRNILLLSIVIQIFAMLHPLSMRMNYYFLLYIPVLIPKIANRSKQQYTQVVKLSTYVMTTYFMYYFLKNIVQDNDALGIIPYIPFWAN